MQTEGATFVHSCPSLYELNISTISPQNTRIYLHYLSLGVPMNDGMIHKTHIYMCNIVGCDTETMNDR